jgi:murein DD-endopeptidase MepM/ murein hydrolase activator NlpD
MNSSPLHVGDVVKVGDLVGLVGQTGEAVGPHLHLGIQIDGVLVDPWPWMKANAAS